MFKNFPLFPESASTVSGEVDAIYLFLVSISIFFSVLIACLVIYFAVRYRRRSESETPAATKQSLALELTWTIIPFLIAMSVFCLGQQPLLQAESSACRRTGCICRGQAVDVEIPACHGAPGDQRTACPGGTRGAPDAGIRRCAALVLRAGVPREIGCRARTLPHHMVRSHQAGKYHLFCAEYCGTKHAGMGGWIYVMEPAEFQTWLSGGPTGGSPVEAGQKLFTDLSCNTCHQQTKAGRGPCSPAFSANRCECSRGKR